MPAAQVKADAETTAAPVIPVQSKFFSTAYIEDSATYNVPGSNGDLWPTAWADDGSLYGANGDGTGFGSTFSDINVSQISGDPYARNITGKTLTSNISQVWTAGNYNRKPTGMISVDGVLYAAVQDLNTDFNDVPAATICKSTDHGKTWTWDTNAPMFNNHIFTTIMFIDYGKDYQNNTDGFVYAYGLDNNWRDSFNDRVPDLTQLFLARVPKASVMDRSKWEFYTGNLNGNDKWSSDINAKQPVLQDDTRLYANTCFPSWRSNDPKNFTIISQGSIVYDKPLNRYIYSAWTEYTFEFYESPTPFGPWKKFLSKDFGGYPWSYYKNGGYATTIPSKFISADGKTLWVQSNTFMGGVDNYGYSLRKLVLEPYTDSKPTNVKNDKNLALTANAPGVTPISKSFHFGNVSFMNYGNKDQSEDSWTGEQKPLDWWGYTWPKKYNMNKVVYTTGKMFGDGGWFKNLDVEVRQNSNWVKVSNLHVTPDYPDESSAGSNKTYQFTFDKTWGDGIRIVGMPGGTSYFTSIGELEVYFSDLLGSDTSSEQQSANLVKDPGFEDQTSGAISSPWAKEGNAGIDRGLGYQNSGSNNAWIRYNSGWNDIKQQIAVEPNHNYILKGYLRTSSNNTDGYFGVRTTSGAVISEQKYGSFATYTPVAIHFNSGANSTIEVYAGMWANNGDTWVQIDDVSVTDDVPAVVSSSPADGAVDVPASGNIVVTFNQDIQAGDVTGITLKKGSTVTDFVYGINGNALMITPSKPLLYNSTYTVTIPAGAVKNASNSSMNTDYSFSFTTAKPNVATP